ncbi:uncharacterized protein LOC134691024 isoform X2 [Mytilus trossulus]
MNKNPTHQENDEEKTMYGMRKIINLQKYGVKSFPYRGRRRYTPSISQSLDGGIVISNDVFGLTIRQFERIYKVCLERRKIHEQWILNLRYPDKSSNEYLEYLQDCVYFNQDILPWPGNGLKDKYLYQHLVYTIGSEMHIRNRQRLFIIEDMIQNLLQTYMPRISSGSLAEGLDLPGSDIDIMFVFKTVDVIQNVRNINHTIQHTTLVMEPDKDYPGFARLRLIAESEEDNNIILSGCCESTTNGEYVSVDGFLHNITRRFSGFQLSSHGPCLSDTDQNVDIAFCVRIKILPYIVIPWVRRHRHKWPPNFVIDKIQNYGCLLVPIGPKNMLESGLLWRLSFSMAEKHLVHSFNFTQLLCYGLLKLTLRRIIYTNADVKDLLCSYFLKTALFWVSEEVDIEIFQLDKLFYCFSLCLDKLILWIKNCYCPNYFIPTHNMFLGTVDHINNQKLMIVLDSIKCAGIDGLINNLFLTQRGHGQIFRSKRETSSIVLDLFLYKTFAEHTAALDISSCYQLLQFVESLQMCESSKFLIDSCKYIYGVISQYTAQLVQPPSAKSKPNNLHKRYHRHLRDSLRTDAVSGWLLYASYYYVTGQYNVTLELAGYVLSRCKPGTYMTYVGRDTYNEEDMNIYKRHVHSKISLNDRIKLATVKSFHYFWHSSLIPEELRLGVIKRGITIPPVVLTFCLRFLCHHHLGDILNRQQALYDLLLTVKDKYLISSDEISISKTILGVCYEISGDVTNAHECYDEAQEDEDLFVF